MARIRSIKPQLRTDLTVAEWPRDARYAWVLLWGYLDDHGRGLDDLRLLVADLFPLDRDVTERKLDGWLKRMVTDSEHGTAPLCRYTVDGRRFLHAPKWTQHQRVSHPQDSRFPPCPVHDGLANESGADREPLPNDSGTVPQVLATSRTPAEQGAGRREVEKGAGSAPAAAGDRGGTERQTLLDEHLAALGQPVPAQTARAFERYITDALTAGTSPTTIRTACAEWRRRPGAKPGLLPHLIGDATTYGHAHAFADDPLSHPDAVAFLAAQTGAAR